MDESVVKVFEEQGVGKLKLSAAIRIGAQMTTQCSRVYVDMQGGACAIGAAYVAEKGYYPASWNPDDFIDWRRTKGLPQSLLMEVYQRNDRGESREQIADWLEAQGY